MLKSAILNIDDLDLSFCNWFVGLVDGEGCFQIKNQKGKSYWLELAISLREDDRTMLEQIQREMHCGHLYFQNATNSASHQSHRYMLRFHNLVEIGLLVSLFNRFPLRSKKGKDFHYWSAAYQELQKPLKSRNIDNLASLYKGIRFTRRFQSFSAR